MVQVCAFPLLVAAGRAVPPMVEHHHGQPSEAGEHGDIWAANDGIAHSGTTDVSTTKVDSGVRHASSAIRTEDRNYVCDSQTTSHHIAGRRNTSGLHDQN
jgi:hypothetical protein